jgi:hypothetical protein
MELQMSEPPKTRQEAFDRIARHLIKQGRPGGEVSPNGFSCQYRAADGSACAIGVLLNDERAQAFDEEGAALANIPPECLPDWIERDIRFYDALQDAHDKPTRTDAEWLPAWRAEMYHIAGRYNLDPSILESAA